MTKFGDWVRITEAYDEKAHLTGKMGIYQGEEDLIVDGEFWGRTPVIKMPSGETIYGFECWWTPL